MSAVAMEGRGGRIPYHLAFGVLLIAYLAAYGATLGTLVYVWGHDGTFQYAFLIVPITLFLVWIRRAEVAGRAFVPNPVGMLLVIGFSLLWLVGNLIGVLLVQHFAVVGLLPSLVLAVYGTAVARVLVFPLLYLFFAFPWPVSRLTALLQHITAVFSVHILQLTGFTVVLHGLLIETPFSTWHVAHACSGIKFFIASLALGALYANLFYRNWRRRAIFMVCAFVVPVIANGFRVYFTVVIGEVFGVQYATGTDHLVFGWQFFGTVLLLLFLGGWHWREDPAPTPRAPAAMATAGAAAARWAGLAGLLLLVGPASGWALAAATPASGLPRQMPSAFGQWRLLLPQANPLGAYFRAPDRRFMGTFIDGRRHVSLIDVEYYGRPRNGHKLFMSGNDVYDRGQWLPVGPASVEHPPHLHAVRQRILRGGGHSRLLWYWYEVSGSTATGLTQTKLHQLFDGLRAAPVSTRAVVLSTPLLAGARGVAAAQRSLADFMRAYAATGHRG